MSGCPFRALQKPVCPKPLKNKAGLITLFFRKGRSWMDGLYDRSYGMKMGEIHLPGMHVFMVNQPDLVQRIMVDDVAAFPKHHMMGDILQPLLGESIFTTNGRQWRKQRDMLDPSFEMARIGVVFDLMRTAVDDMMKRLSWHDLSRPVDIDAEMTYVTADIIFRTILSVNIEGEAAKRIFEDFVLFQKESPKAALRRVFGLPVWWPFGRKGKTERLKAGRDIRSAIAEVIRPRYDAVRSGTPGPEKDILASILTSVDADTGEGFSFDEIVDQVAMLFLAGHETSASALMWSLYLLSITPDAQEKAAQEVSTHGCIDVASLRQMTFIRDVFREALRLYPPVGFFARETAQDTQMRDKKMKKGALVVVAPWLIHRHRDYWNHPQDFDPSRFTSANLKTPLKDSYLPFGMGPRVCIGLAFAMQEASLILATLLKNYRFMPVDGFVPKPVGRITVRSENGMWLKMEER